jgi:hypothetical protein
MPKIYSKMMEEERKCGGCNYTCSVFYSVDNIDITKHGICANCFMEMLVDGGYTIIDVEKKKKIIGNLNTLLKDLETWEEWDLSEQGNWISMQDNVKQLKEMIS